MGVNPANRDRAPLPCRMCRTPASRGRTEEITGPPRAPILLFSVPGHVHESTDGQEAPRWTGTGLGNVPEPTATWVSNGSGHTVPTALHGDGRRDRVRQANGMRVRRRAARARSSHGDARVVLMSSPRPRADGNPYLELLGRALQQVGVTPVYFSWRRAILGRYDVVHVHWPETLLRAGGSVRTVLKRALFGLLLFRLRIQRVPLVRTVHNSEPHEAFSRTEAILARWLDRAVRRRIYMSGAVDRGGHLIRHGHYRDVYSLDTHSEPKVGRILYFGAIRRYKQVPQLCRAFATVRAPSATLRVVGKPATDQLRLDVERAAASDSRISVDLARVDPRRLAEEIYASQLVVLPFEDFENSGSALLALSLDRPILVPDSASSRELLTEVGDGWVVTYQPPLTGRVIEEALAKVSAHDAGAHVNFVGRDWIDIAREHAAVYEDAWRTGRRRP